MTMAQLAAVLRQNKAQVADDVCAAPCRIQMPPTLAELRWLEHTTRVTWRWFHGTAHCDIGIDELRDCDCRCLAWASSRYVMLALEGNDDGDDPVERAEAAAKLAVGSGRVVTLTITSPIKPSWSVQWS